MCPHLLEMEFDPVRILIRTTPVLMVAALALASCGTTDGTSTGSTAAPGGTTAATATPSGTAAAPSGTAVAGAYTPVSDVASHAAIGGDVATIKKELGKAKDGPVDWAAVKKTFTEGGSSKKGDGSFRTLEKLVDAPEVVSSITAAISGGEGGDAVRAQRVEKGITALLYLKVLDELEAAEKKIADKKTDAKDGAPHNVDEAWAFYTADGNGLQSTAKKRGDDFKKSVDAPILEQLTAAQRAAGTGDAKAFDEAEDGTRHALNYIFYLATYKYLDNGGDAIKKVEGETFYLAIAPIVKKASPESDSAITAAFASGDAKAGRAALNTPAVLSALGVEQSQAITS